MNLVPLVETTSGFDDQTGEVDVVNQMENESMNPPYLDPHYSHEINELGNLKYYEMWILQL